ncbi:pilus assembly protein [Paenalcaligenes niemegkensis]|uniref:TadE/TadG family type IV pilus assembly protein n=1 Tax=Paenalcaligenes niemegkensis TaxID=2895469 RepID=UPI001EE7E4AB|nr:TadE/TadG family type IV pilus assembly protein [Paenalcaligenes niemegkensis]MCQ9616202.1 pilus assembly protein [Paenalcaligenes niemegkensis]
MQRGQAIVEFVVVLPVLLLFFFAAHWLLNLQHQKSSLQNQAANASWLLSRMASPDTDEDPAAQPLNAFKTQGSGSSGSFFSCRTMTLPY